MVTRGQYILNKLMQILAYQIPCAVLLNQGIATIIYNVCYLVGI